MVDGQLIFIEEFLNVGLVNCLLYQVGVQFQGCGYFQDYNYEIQWSNEFVFEGIVFYDMMFELLIFDFLGVVFIEDEQKVYDCIWSLICDYMLECQ